MKRVTTIGLIAAIAVMILLAGCGKKTQEQPAVTDPAKPVETPKAPEAQATAPIEAKPAEAAPAAQEPIQASDLGIDEKSSTWVTTLTPGSLRS